MVISKQRIYSIYGHLGEKMFANSQIRKATNGQRLLCDKAYRCPESQFQWNLNTIIGEDPDYKFLYIAPAMNIYGLN